MESYKLGFRMISHTSHCLWPWNPFGFRVFTATGILDSDSGVAAQFPLPSTQPLNTVPKPPLPRKLLVSKFIVAIWISRKVNLLRLEEVAINSWPSLLDEAFFDLLRRTISFLTFLPVHYIEKTKKTSKKIQSTTWNCTWTGRIN